MQPKVNLREDDGVVLEFDGLEPVSGFFEAAARQGGFVVSLPRELRMFGRTAFSVHDGAALRFEFEAEVIQVFPAGPGVYGTAFQLAGWSEAKQQELERRLRDAANPAIAEAAPDPDAAAAAADPDAGDPAATRPAADVPAVFAIREMNVTEKIRLATKASRGERQILVQDTSPQVLLALLANPRLDEEEILQITRSTHSSTAVLQQIASNQRWGASYEVQRTLVLNPKTPTPLAMKLLESLRTPDLSMLSKSGRAREPLRKAALRLFLKRTQR